MRTPELTTERLLLRPIRAEDTEAVFNCWMRDEAVSRYMWWKASDDIADTRAFIEFELERIDDPKWVRRIIEKRDTGEVIGTCVLFWNDDDDPAHWDIGYNLGRAFWGAGYTTEAMRAMLRFAADEMGVREIVTSYAAVNTASASVLRKLGFTDTRDIPYVCGGGSRVVAGRECRLTLERKKTMIETERLLLREYTMDDFEPLYAILSDPETMRHYPAPFSEEKTRGWIAWNLDNYRKYGFGLWAVTLKDTGEFIGDCGLTLQIIDGEELPEIGYHIRRDLWRRGYGKEAACAVRDWAFENTPYDVLYSYMKYTNAGSYSTAIANGMKKVKEYPDPKNTISYAYAVTRGEWEALKQCSPRT